MDGFGRSGSSTPCRSPQARRSRDARRPVPPLAACGEDDVDQAREDVQQQADKLKGNLDDLSKDDLQERPERRRGRRQERQRGHEAEGARARAEDRARAELARLAAASLNRRTAGKPPVAFPRGNQLRFRIDVRRGADRLGPAGNGLPRAAAIAAVRRRVRTRRVLALRRRGARATPSRRASSAAASSSRATSSTSAARRPASSRTSTSRRTARPRSSSRSTTSYAPLRARHARDHPRRAACRRVSSRYVQLMLPSEDEAGDDIPDGGVINERPHDDAASSSTSSSTSSTGPTRKALRDFYKGGSAPYAGRGEAGQPRPRYLSPQLAASDPPVRGAAPRPAGAASASWSTPRGSSPPSPTAATTSPR